MALAPASSDLTGPKCSPNSVQWTYDTWMLANGTGKAVVKTGGDTWFFLTADYAFGHALERDTSAVVEKNGGKVVGQVQRAAQYPGLLFVPAAGAGLEGKDHRPGQRRRRHHQFDQTGRRIRHYRRRPALRRASGVHQRRRRRLGLKTAQGLVLTETFYWDMNDASRAFTKRWQVAAARPGKFPSMVPAGVYASVLHYLKAVAALKSAADGKAVVAKMKEMPTDDPLFGKGIDPRRRPQAARRLSVRGEEAGRVEISRRLLQDSRHHPGGRSVPPAQGRQLPAGQRLTSRLRFRRGSGSRPSRMTASGPLTAVRLCREAAGCGDACLKFSASPRRRCSDNCCSG